MLALVAAVVVGIVASVPAQAVTPYVPITSARPPLPAAGGSHGQVCATGPSCIQRTIADMQRRVDRLAETCDHNALFALTYLRVTETFAWWIARSRSVYGGDYLDELDRRFALRYFDAYDNWLAGRRAQVPQAWRMAFDAARQRSLDGPGDVLLAINAHVYEDLPFVLYDLGLVGRDRSSHKPDYNRVNNVFAETITPLVAELAARFDPQIALLNAAGQAGPAAVVQLQATAREDVWRAAEELADAPNAGARSILAAMIHARAQGHAELILATNSYHPPVTGTADRDAYCRQHHNDAAPQPYPFGSA